MKIKYPFYLKYGFAFSKRVGLLEPVVGFYRFGLHTKYYNFDFTRIYAFNYGLGIHHKSGAILIGEVNWFPARRNIGNGIGIISLGMRVPVEKKLKKN